MNASLTTIEPVGHCRVCKGTALRPLFSLGEHYINDFPKPGCAYDGLKVPITLELCLNPDCHLVQLQHTAPQDLLYSRHYWYRSGVTETMRAALADVVNDVLCVADLRSGDIVLDIGSNDGTLLRCYPSDLLRIGVEPADNLATTGNYAGLELLHDFWPVKGFLPPGDKVMAVTALGMFYDLDDPVPFVQAIADVLHPQGVFIAQLMCLQNMLILSDIGNLTHEHLEFYSLQSLVNLFAQAGLEIFDIRTVPINGASYRVYAKHRDAMIPAYYGADARLREAVARETRFADPGTYEAFYYEARQRRNQVIAFLHEAADHGANIWVYGASTKGNTLLQFYGLDSTIITGAAERSPEKWGRVTVGTNIPIYSEDVFRNHSPDYALVLPYTFIDEFKTRELRWLQSGGEFIVPLPTPRRVFWQGPSLQFQEAPL